MRRALIVAAVVASAALYAWADSETGIGTYLELRREVGRVEQRTDRRAAEIERLKAEARALESDPFAIERAIREELDLARPGEVVVELPPPDSSSPRFP